MPSQSTIFAAVIRFVLSLILAGFDFHRKVIEVGTGVAPLSYWESPAAVLFALVFASISAILFVLSLAEKTFFINHILDIVGHNIYARALFCSFSTTIIIRSKIADFGRKNFGPDYYYEVFRAWCVGAYKDHSATLRSKYTIYTDDRFALYPEFSTILIDFLEHRINYRDKKKLTQFRKAVGGLLSDASPLGRRQYNRQLIGISIDYIGLAATKNWVRHYLTTVKRAG